MRTTLIVAAAAAAVTTVVSTGPASAASPPLSGARTAVHFDLAAGHVPRQVVGRDVGCGKLGTRGSAAPMWTSWGRFQARASCGRTVL